MTSAAFGDRDYSSGRPAVETAEHKQALNAEFQNSVSWAQDKNQALEEPQVILASELADSKPAVTNVTKITEDKVGKVANTTCNPLSDVCFSALRVLFALRELHLVLFYGDRF